MAGAYKVYFKNTSLIFQYWAPFSEKDLAPMIKHFSGVYIIYIIGSCKRKQFPYLNTKVYS